MLEFLESHFEDDHGRAFGDALSHLRGELDEGHEIEQLLNCFTRESAAFGRVRKGDPTEALRILALDGYLTEFLGLELTGDKSADLDKYTQILTGQFPMSADN